MNRKPFDVPMGYTGNMHSYQQICDHLLKIIVRDRHKCAEIRPSLENTGAAASQCVTHWGCRGGDPRPPPPDGPKPWGRLVGPSATGLPGGGGGAWVPQHTYVKMIPMTRTSGEKNFQNFFACQLRLPSAKGRPRGWVGVRVLFRAFQPFLKTPQNDECFEYRHIGSNTKNFLLPYGENKISSARKTQNLVQPFWGL